MTIIPFSSTQASLSNAGGKGANLARLAQAGFPVPPGYIIATQAYARFVQANGLAARITEQLEGLAPDGAAQLEAASKEIRAAFSAGAIAGDDRAEILDAYAKLGGGPVAGGR